MFVPVHDWRFGGRDLDREGLEVFGSAKKEETVMVGNLRNGFERTQEWRHLCAANRVYDVTRVV